MKRSSTLAEPNIPQIKISQLSTMSLINKTTPSPTPEIAEQLLQAANDIALKYAQTYTWSTWHSWNVVDTNKPPVDLRATDRGFWRLTGDFGTSLGASTRIVASLRAELWSHAIYELREYADTVQLLTCAKRATAETGYHAVVAMCFENFAIVVDHALHPTAFRVPLGGAFDMLSDTPLSRQQGQASYYYLLEDGEYRLTLNNTKTSGASLRFSGMDVDDAISQLTIPAALEKQPVEGLENELVPTCKYLSIRSLFDEKPQFITSSPVDGKYIATAVRIEVDFALPRIKMQVPMADWLQKPQHQILHDTIFRETHKGLQVTVTEGTVWLEQQLYGVDCEQPYFELSGLFLMQRVGEKFGLKCSVLNEVMWSAYRVWASYRSKRCDSFVDGEMPVEVSGRTPIEASLCLTLLEQE